MAPGGVEPPHADSKFLKNGRDRRQGASAWRCSATPVGRASAAQPRSADSPSVGSRAPGGGRAGAADHRPADGLVIAAAPHFRRTSSRCQRRSVCGVTSSPAAAGVGAPTRAPRGKHDRPAGARGGASAGEAAQADTATRATRRLWRTRAQGVQQAAAEQLRTRGKRRKGASGDAPRADHPRREDQEPRF
jgi:hypothetical protein